MSDDAYRSELQLDITSFLNSLQESKKTIAGTATTEVFIKKRKQHSTTTESLQAGMGNQSGPGIVLCLGEARSLSDDEREDTPSALFRGFQQALKELFEETLPLGLARKFQSIWIYSVSLLMDALRSLGHKAQGNELCTNV